MLCIAERKTRHSGGFEWVTGRLLLEASGKDQTREGKTEESQRPRFGDAWTANTIYPDRKSVEVFECIGPRDRTESARELNDAITLASVDCIADDGDRPSASTSALIGPPP